MTYNNYNRNRNDTAPRIYGYSKILLCRDCYRYHRIDDSTGHCELHDKTVDAESFYWRVLDKPFRYKEIPF